MNHRKPWTQILAKKIVGKKKKKFHFLSKSKHGILNGNETKGGPSPHFFSTAQSESATDSRNAVTTPTAAAHVTRPSAVTQQQRATLLEETQKCRGVTF